MSVGKDKLSINNWAGNSLWAHNPKNNLTALGKNSIIPITILLGTYELNISMLIRCDIQKLSVHCTIIRPR